MSGFESKRQAANDRFNEPKIYEHEVVTTVRITVRSLEPYLDKAKFLEDYAYLTDFGNFTESDDYPRVVATSVIDDEIDYMDKELEDE
jgi:hypothetical protein